MNQSLNQKKKVLILLLLSIQLITFSTELNYVGVGFNFEINGKLINGQAGSWVYLNHKWENTYFKDSTRLDQKGMFNFRGKSLEKNMYWINNAQNLNTPLIFFVDQERIEINGHIDSLPNSRVKAGKVQDDYVNYLQMINEFAKKKMEMENIFGEAQRKGDQTKMMSLKMEYMNLDEEEKKSIYNFINNNNSSPVAGLALFQNFQENADLLKLEALYNNFSSDLQSSKFGKLAFDKINSLKGSSIGYTATDFSQNTPEGKEIKLSSFRGKYVLVDFWASWCGPCRQENPNVVMAYNKFKDKGFDILGVSLDNNKDKWLKAVEKDKLTWTHVSDLQGWDNSVAMLFGVRSIPTNLLIDREGKIIAKNLRGIDLENKLKEVFGE